MSIQSDIVYDLSGMRAQIIDNWRSMHPKDPAPIISVRKTTARKYGAMLVSVSQTSSTYPGQVLLNTEYLGFESAKSAIHAVLMLLDEVCKMVDGHGFPVKNEDAEIAEEWDLT